MLGGVTSSSGKVQGFDWPSVNMCTRQSINPDLAPEEFGAFDSDEGDCSYLIEDEHHNIFDYSGYADAREQFRDLFESHVTTVTWRFSGPASMQQAGQVSPSP